MPPLVFSALTLRTKSRGKTLTGGTARFAFTGGPTDCRTDSVMMEEGWLSWGRGCLLHAVPGGTRETADVERGGGGRGGGHGGNGLWEPSMGSKYSQGARVETKKGRVVTAGFTAVFSNYGVRMPSVHFKPKCKLSSKVKCIVRIFETAQEGHKISSTKRKIVVSTNGKVNCVKRKIRRVCVREEILLRHKQLRPR